MIKYTIVFILAFVSFSFTNNELRNNFYKAVQNEEEAKRFITVLETKNTKNALDIAYLGATQAVMGKHAFNPYNKMKWVEKANITMSKAVSQDPNNLEIRFLRFSYQHYVPAFLGYSKNINEDLAIIQKEIMNNAQAYPLDLIKNVAGFLIETGRCSDKFEQKLKVQFK